MGWIDRYRDDIQNTLVALVIGALVWGGAALADVRLAPVIGLVIGVAGLIALEWDKRRKPASLSQRPSDSGSPVDRAARIVSGFAAPSKPMSVDDIANKDLTKCAERLDVLLGDAEFMLMAFPDNPISAPKPDLRGRVRAWFVNVESNLSECGGTRSTVWLNEFKTEPPPSEFGIVVTNSGAQLQRLLRHRIKVLKAIIGQAKRSVPGSQGVEP